LHFGCLKFHKAIFSAEKPHLIAAKELKIRKEILYFFPRSLCSLAANYFAMRHASIYSPRVQLQREELLAPLKQFFGFSSFRPLQEKSSRRARGQRRFRGAAGRVAANRFCFQLPALVRPGLTVVDLATHRG